ncbi:ubiquitin-like domain-containing protein CIP73 [Tasmannia lanceolata]|uniref:ubiquitin-like domain-containing protein CIP73 n=1 Tax=Tasmannia lanceolata TaxID=3420 RepID=UPI0040630154
MTTNGADGVLFSGGDEAECSETMVEIKIKTLDSQTYTLRVNKRMPVPALKEQIATVTGVLSEQQRLICRGKVLKDDQLLSAYHVEDGHTLHLVVRQPLPSSSSTTGLMGSESAPDNPATDPASNATHNRGNQVAHSVMLGTFNVSEQGDGAMQDLGRIISSVLSSIGIGNTGTGAEGIDLRDYGSERLGSVQVQADQTAARAQLDPLDGAFRLPPAVSTGPMQPTPIPDSLSTLSQYLSHLIHEFSANGISDAMQRRNTGAGSHTGAGQGLPTPASLAEVMLSTRQMLLGQAGECLSQLATQLAEEAGVTDPLARMSIQSRTMRSGVLLQNLGALLLELGRTTMTLRMGRTPSEAVVNAGPAVFISRSGPNPIMVQPVPFQPGTSFGATPMGSVHPSHSSAGGTLGSGFLPRNIDIRIRTGSSMFTSDANNLGEPAGSDQPHVQMGPTRSPSIAGDSGVRVVPVRTVVAAVPATASRPRPAFPGSSVGLFYPLVARFPNPSTGPSNDPRGSQASSEHQSNLGLNIGAAIGDGNLQTDNFFAANSVSAVPSEMMNPSANASTQQQQGPSLTSSTSQQEIPGNSNNSNNTQSSDASQNLRDSAIHNESRFDRLLSTIFQGEQFHVSDVNFQGGATGSVAETIDTTREAEAHESSRAEDIDQGIFFSNLVRQIMPFISQSTGMGPSDASPVRIDTAGPRTSSDSSTAQTERENSFGIGSSHRHGGPSSPPNSKRHKRE